MPEDVPPTIVPTLAPQPAPESQAGLVSVVVLCCGQLEYTRLCAASVFRFSRPPFEVIAVDAGTLDGTADFWAGVQTAAGLRVEIVRSSADADLPAALRAGIERAAGEFVVLLDNDTVVTAGWLNHLTALLTASSAFGMVAPVVTHGSGAQAVGPLPDCLRMNTAPTSWEEIGAQIEEVNRFALGWGEQHQGQWSEAERLGGGCMMLRRSALQMALPVPGAPLRFYDPEALSRRVRGTGFRLACCHDLFVHSFGSRWSASPR